MRKAFKSSVVFDQQVVSRDTMPTAMLETYHQCDTPPPLDKLNVYRYFTLFLLPHWSHEQAKNRWILFEREGINLLNKWKKKMKYHWLIKFCVNCREDGKDGLKFYTDPNYFFDLWSQEMLKDTEKKLHDRGKKVKRNFVSLFFRFFSYTYIRAPRFSSSFSFFFFFLVLVLRFRG